MNLDSLSFALSQISYSVANLTKKNFRSSVAEITHLVARHGAEADRHLFRCLFSHVDFTGDGKSSGKDFHQTQFLIQECTTLITKPNFISTLCYAIDNPLHYQKTIKPSAHLFSQLSKVLKLSRVQEVVFGIALLNSCNAETRSYASQFVKHKLPDLLRSYIDTDTSSNQEGGLQDIAIEVLHLLLTHLVHGKDQFGIGSDQKEAFLKTLRKDFPQDRVPVVLAPVLYPETQDVGLHKLLPQLINRPKMAGSLADMILELGYGCTASIDECRSTLAQFGVRELNSSSVARVLGVMARTPSGLSDQISVQSLNTPGGGIWGDGKENKADSSGLNTWNVDVFVQVVQDMVPHLSWREVIAELDHPGFLVNGKTGLRILVQGLFRGLMQEVFSVESFFKPWKNQEGQLSFITSALKNPDVFCFADYPCRIVVIDILKTPPDEDNREIATWKSLGLVETLLQLYEAGHFQQVTELFKFPLQHCPDMLVLALLQIPIWNALKQDLISNLMPIFLGNHPNSAIVLQHAWHCQGQSTTIRTLIMHSMAEWYMRGEQHDQSRLSRILDVAQDLKALSMLLNATPFAFVIDLACLASRREYLKLDKWLSDKIREHGEPFVQACTNFLKRRCPQLYGGQMKDEPQNKAQQLPTETLTTMLHCLQAFAGSVAQELSEAILTMCSNAHSLLNKQRQGPPVALPAKQINPSLPNLTSNPMELGSMAVGMAGNMSGIMASGLSGGISARLGGGISGNLSGSINSGLSGGLSSSLSGGMSGALAGGIAGGMGALAGLGAGVSGVGTGFPQALNTTPGSPAKGFPNINQSSQGQPFAMQSISASLQGLNLPSTMSTGMSSGRTPTLGSLSASAAIKQQQNAERIRQTGQAGGADLSSIFPEMSQQFSKEIEDEANSYFQRIYNHPPHPTISIDEVLEMLKRFKDSPNKKERDVFVCMLRNLFEEYRFFPQYPDKELHTTAVLFGGIIEQGLVTLVSSCVEYNI